VTKEVYNLLEHRNRDGHTCFTTAIKADKAEIIAYLLSEEFPNLDLFGKDTLEGDIPLHLAVRMGNKELAMKLFKLRPEKCLLANFKGQTPIFLATQMQDLEMLEIFG